MVFCIAFLILALLVGHFRELGNFGVETDFYGAYAEQAENTVAGRPYTYQHNPPGYVILLAAVSFLTGDLFVAGKIITAVAAALFGWIIYSLFKALFDNRIALASTILSLLALFPYSFLVATDILGALLMMLPLWIILRQPVLTLKTCFLGGILAGIAYLVRYNAVFVIIGIGISFLFINLNQETVQKRIAMVGLFVCGTLLITFPWLIVNWQTNGSPFASTAYLQIAAHFYHPAGDVFVMKDAFDFNSLLDVILYDPLTFLRKYLSSILNQNIYRLTTTGLRFPAYLFAGAGFLFLFSDLSRRKLTFLLVCFFGYLSLGLVGFYLRYYFFLFPLLFLLVTYFLFHPQIFMKLGYLPYLRTPISWLVIAILSLFLARNAYLRTRSTLAAEPRHVFQIADFLRARSLPNDIIIALKGHYAYYAGLEKSFPVEQSPHDCTETAEDYIANALKIGARYIVYSDYEASCWSGLKCLSNPDATPNSLRLIYRHEPSKTLIYEVHSSGDITSVHPEMAGFRSRR